MMKLLARPVAEKIQFEVQARVQSFVQRYGRVPKLTVVLVGDNPASVIYTTKKGEMAQSLGMTHETIRLPVTSSPEEVKAVIEGLNQDPAVDGILIQRPLPSSFSEEEVLYWVAPEKDVDAFHPVNAGRLFLGLPCFQPCTPAGIMALLDYYKIQVQSKLTCVIGRSSIVGKPMAALLLKADATVLHCHSKTHDLKQMARQADILVVAAGKMEMVDHSYVREGAVVVDVGIHRKADKKVVGDVLFEDVASHCSAITPVPGGVGPMTIAVLMQNTIWAAEERQRR